MSNSIEPYVSDAISDVKRLANIVLSLRDEVFKKGLDYGVIPGTGDKPTLLLPGMEKLMRALHLRPEYVERSRIEDFDKPLIYYRYECRLIDYETGVCISTALGSANSMESKWRWRAAERVCPTCGKPTIIKGKAEYGGGWLCFAKKGGCGAKFIDNDPQIVNQNVGRVENPDILDQTNTIDKIAQKRALGSAIKGAANVSEFFTVDLEDFQQFDTGRPLPENVVDGQFTVVEAAHASRSASTDEPSAGVRGAGITGVTPNTLGTVQKPVQQPADKFDEEFPPMGSQQVGRPDETEDPLNLYRVDALIVTQSKTARQYVLKVQRSATRIVVSDMAVFEGLTLGDTPVQALKPGEYPLSPAWTVYADTSPSGAWEILEIVTAIPV